MNKAVKILFNTTIDYFCLAVGLWLVWWWHPQFGIPAKSSCQKVLTNTGSRSLMIDLGIPWCLTTASMNMETTDLAVYECERGTKWIAFDKRSRITRIEVWRSKRGRPSMKSIETSSHNLCGIGNGWSNPLGAKLSDFALWHVSHSVTYLCTVLCIDGQ